MVKCAADEVYDDIRKVAKIPGFRPGNAPRDLLEKHYSKSAEEEILKKLVPKGYKKALETHKISPLGVPRIFNIVFEKDKLLTFEAEVDIQPNIRLRKYKGIEVTKKRISVSKEEKDEAVERLRNMYVTHRDADRPVQKGDYAVCDIEAFGEGKPISKKNNNLWILADKEASLLGMGEKLIGLTKGQMKEIDTTLPQDYPDKKYAGKAAKFKILVNSVKEKVLPEMDSEFCKKLNVENAEVLAREIESQLFLRKENDLKIRMKNQILERLLRDTRFAVPSSLVRRQKEIFTKQLKDELQRKGLAKDDIEKKEKEFSGKIEKDAEGRVRIYFILDDIALKEKIDVTDEDVEGRIKSVAIQTGKPFEEVKKYYEKENLLGGLAEEIKETKVLDLLLKHADVKEEK